MPHSVNDYAADTLATTLETLWEAHERCETEEEEQAVQKAIAATERARSLILKRERPTPTQRLVDKLNARE